ncbi:MAG: glycoside hydrolase [Bryobacteraceae bacterium]|jgi:hypothetical protein
MRPQALFALCLCASAAAAPYASNRYLQIRLDEKTHALTVTDRRTHSEWTQKPPGPEFIVAGSNVEAGGIRLALHDKLNNLDIGVVIALAKDQPEFEIELSANGPLDNPVAYPPAFVSGKGAWLIVPMNEGIMYPADDASIQSRTLLAYSGHGICMPWFGVTAAESGEGFMAILGTPDDARIEITRRGGLNLYIQPQWEASRGQFGYERKIRYVFFQRGGYVAQAKRYREYAKTMGLFKTLAAKRRDNPNVDLLVGAVNVWNWDMKKVELAKEMKSLGMEHVLWSSGGEPKEIEAINDLGYLSSRYDIYQDVFPPEAPQSMKHAGWPDDLVWLPNGEWMKGWAHRQKNPDGSETVFEGGVINSQRGLERAKLEIPQDLKTHAYRCRFIDTTTASPFREDYNPAHPLTRSEDRQYKMKLLEYCSRDEKLVVGTETGIDPSVPYVHYYEGMMSLGPYRLPDAGRDMLQYKPPTPDFLKFQVGHFYRIPLWELVYHDCVVAQWYWGDYNNKAPEVWQRRDLYNILYGTPPMFMFNQDTWQKQKGRFAASYQEICPLVRRLGYDEMISHEFLSPDHAVQRTRWKSGAEIVVNFGDSAYRLADGRTVEPAASLVRRP